MAPSRQDSPLQELERLLEQEWASSWERSSVTRAPHDFRVLSASKLVAVYHSTEREHSHDLTPALLAEGIEWLPTEESIGSAGIFPDSLLGISYGQKGSPKRHTVYEHTKAAPHKPEEAPTELVALVPFRAIASLVVGAILVAVGLTLAVANSAGALEVIALSASGAVLSASSLGFLIMISSSAKRKKALHDYPLHETP